MDRPTDYPLDSVKDELDASTADITLAILKDRVNEQKPVSNEMIRIAHTKLETAYVDTNNATSTPLRSKLSSIRERFKAN